MECVYCEIYDNDSRGAIVQFCKEQCVSLVVTGKRGLGPIKSLLLGSVSGYVVQHVPCAVIVFDEHKEQEEVCAASAKGAQGTSEGDGESKKKPYAKSPKEE